MTSDAVGAAGRDDVAAVGWLAASLGDNALADIIAVSLGAVLHAARAANPTPNKATLNLCANLIKTVTFRCWRDVRRALSPVIAIVSGES